MLQGFKNSEKVAPYSDTPDPVIRQMIDAAKRERKLFLASNLRPLITYILEPEFGTGMMLKEIDAAFTKSQITGIEVNPSLYAQAGSIYNKIGSFGNNAIKLYNADFLGFDVDKRKYHLIFMNPPYAGRAFINHIKHAIQMLEENGILIALLPETVFYSISLDAIGFRAILGKYITECSNLGPVVCSYPVNVCMLKVVNRPSVEEEVSRMYKEGILNGSII